MVKRSYDIIFYISAGVWGGAFVLVLMSQLIRLVNSISQPSNVATGYSQIDVISDITRIIGFILLSSIFIVGLWWKSFRKKRTMANRLAQHNLAIQPKPDENALPLPTTIELVMNQWVGLGQFLFAQITLILLWICISFIWIGNFFVTLPFFIVSECGIIGLFLWLMAINRHQSIEITDKSLTFRTMKWHNSMRWEDVRHFVIVPSQISIDELTYEIISDANSLTFSEIHTPIAHEYAPTILLEDYNRQIEALVSLVATRTGLPLYDLRKN